MIARSPSPTPARLEAAKPPYPLPMGERKAERSAHKILPPEREYFQLQRGFGRFQGDLQNRIIDMIGELLEVVAEGLG